MSDTKESVNNSKKVKIDIASTITNLMLPDDDMYENSDEYGAEGGRFGEKPQKNKMKDSGEAPPPGISISTDGTLSDTAGRIEISYNETELTGMAGSVTSISFEKQTPYFVTMSRSGTYSALLVFNSENKRQRCVYNSKIMPPFELTVCTRYIENGITFDNGGTLVLDYFIEMGGIETEYGNVKISVRNSKLDLDHECC